MSIYQTDFDAGKNILPNSVELETRLGKTALKCIYQDFLFLLSTLLLEGDSDGHDSFIVLTLELIARNSFSIALQFF